MADALEQFDQIPTGQKAALLLLLGAGIFFAFFFLAFKPLEKSIDQQRTTLATVEASIQNLTQTQAQVESLREQISVLCVQREQVFRQLPPEPFGPQLRSRIETLTYQAEVKLLRVSPFDDQPGDAYSTLPFDMVVRGTYAQLSDFFYQVGREDRIMNVRGLDLTSVEGGTAEAGLQQLTAEFRLESYFEGTNGTQGDAACALEEDPS